MVDSSQRFKISRAVSPWVGRVLGEMARNDLCLFAPDFTASSRPYEDEMLEILRLAMILVCDRLAFRAFD